MLSVSGCIFNRLSVEDVPRSEALTVVTSPVKAHMLDGSTVVFSKGATVGNGFVRGEGERYALGSTNPVVVVVVPLDSVVGMETYQLRVDIAPTILASTAALVLGAGVATVAAVAMFGSCPTFYSDSSGKFVLEAEGFSYSIAPLFEQRDVDRLRTGAAPDGTVHLEVRNEALETHYINHLELIETRHRRGETVVPDQRGFPLVVGELSPALSARDRAGRNVSRVLASADGDIFATDSGTLAAADSTDLEDYVDITAPRPGTGDSIAIVFRLRNSLLNTVLMYDGMLADPGAASLDWLGSDIQKITNAIDLGRWYAKHMGMRISVRDGGEYRQVARFGDKGPIAFHDVAVIIPAPKGDSIRVRLSFVADNWRIDKVSFATKFFHAPVRTISLHTVVGSDGVADTAAFAALAAADDRYLSTAPGQRFSALFVAGPIASDSARTFLLASQGYYTEWVRGSWINRKGAAASPFVANEASIARAIGRWRSKQADLEHQFYSTAIPTR
ncbi:MAG: hypothetical protein M3373_07205 [Gemmatimonadota bacterium]|nr:hypothetical protein [Gemmatimonadota bacterium]